MAVFVCKLPGGPEMRFEAPSPAAAAWAFVARAAPNRGRVSVVVWRDEADSVTIAMSIDPLDDTPMGGRAAALLTPPGP